MVQDVEGLDPQGQVALVVEVEVLAEAEVPVPVLGPAHYADAGVPELARGSVLEALDVEPEVVDAGAGDLRAAARHEVRPLERPCRLERLPGAVPDGHREAAVRLEDAVEVPPAEDGVLGAAPIAPVLPALAEGDLVVGGE